MTYEQIKKLKAREFKRLCGVKPQLFKEMTEILEQELPKPKQRGGQPKLSIEDQLLIALEYWREYRTYFHIGQSWGIHTSSYTPIKKKKEKTLALREKEYNRELAQQRIYIEPPTRLEFDSRRNVAVHSAHVIRCLKIFRILAQPYRNRRRRFGLRFNLIAGLYNRGLDLAIA